jgi:hypothetical protein
MSDFDWFGEKDRDAIVLQYQPPTAVYRTKAGSIVVRQKMEQTEEYDPEIFLTPQGALAVAWALIEEAHLEGLPQASLSLMVESEHWPPVHRRPGPTETHAPEAGPPNDGTPGPLLAAMEAAQ